MPGNNRQLLGECKLHAQHLCDEDGRDSLIQCCAIQIDRCTQWQDKGTHLFLHPQILLHTFHGYRKGGSAGTGGKCQQLRWGDTGKEFLQAVRTQEMNQATVDKDDVD